MFYKLTLVYGVLSTMSTCTTCCRPANRISNHISRHCIDERHRMSQVFLAHGYAWTSVCSVYGDVQQGDLCSLCLTDDRMRERTLADAAGRYHKAVQCYSSADALALGEFLLNRLDTDQLHRLLDVIAKRERGGLVLCTQFPVEGCYTRLDIASENKALASPFSTSPYTKRSDSHSGQPVNADPPLG